MQLKLSTLLETKQPVLVGVLVIIAAHILTLSFKAVCAISSMCNGRFDVSVVYCTAIARFVRLLMQSPRLNAGRGGKGATAESVLTCLAMPAV